MFVKINKVKNIKVFWKNVIEYISFKNVLFIIFSILCKIIINIKK